MKGWKLWGSLVALFLSGVYVGGVGAWLYIDRQMEQRWEGGPQAKKQWIMKRLTRELGLTSEQQAAIEPIVTRTQIELLTLRAQQRSQVEAILAASRAAMADVLTSAQQEKLQALHEKLQRRWQKTEAYLRAQAAGAEGTTGMRR